MVRKKLKGTKLKVFSGREESLNRIIFYILRRQALIPYDVWLSVKAIKGYKHTRYKTICRRMHVLAQQGWIAQTGKRPTRSSGHGQLYDLTLKGRAAFILGEKSIEVFLQVATDEQLLKLIEALE